MFESTFSGESTASKAVLKSGYLSELSEAELNERSCFS
jgi:hypothetical protein